MADLPAWLVWGAFMIGVFGIATSMFHERTDLMLGGFAIALAALFSFQWVS